MMSSTVYDNIYIYCLYVYICSILIDSIGMFMLQFHWGNYLHTPPIESTEGKTP